MLYNSKQRTAVILFLKKFGILTSDRVEVVKQCHRAKFCGNQSYCYQDIAVFRLSRWRPNFAVLSRGRHLYSAGRPSRWMSAYTPVLGFGKFGILTVVIMEIVKMRQHAKLCCGWSNRSGNMTMFSIRRLLQ